MAWFAILLAVLFHPAQARPFELKEGDRVALLGDALAEAMQERGDLELRLTARFPETNLRFRNLAFAGDTVWGDALAAFDTAAEGYQRRLELVRKAQPTVLFLAFGSNESWAGAAGLDPFLKGYERLLDDLKTLDPREVVLLGPLPQENLGPPFPDPTTHNTDISQYRQAIESLAARRGLRFVDLAPASASTGDPPGTIPAYPLTDDGLHPTESGHARIAQTIETGLGLSALTEPTIELEPSPDAKARTLARRSQALARLPSPGSPSPTGLATGPLIVSKNLPPGRYTLLVDGQPVASAGASGWAEGIRLPGTADLDQVDRLRQAIARKNRMFFDQVRPQNNVYLFGFRKHEQGNNAAEIPMFDPLIAEMEAEIARLRRPQARTYELVREIDEVKP